MSILKDTNTFSPSIEIPKTIKTIVKISELISTKLTTWLVSKLFTTPITYKTPKREMAMEKSAQKKKIYINSIQKEVHILSYGYSKKKVLLAHGWAGRSTQLFMVADKLLEKGYMVISFDAPAHGKSTGKTTNMIEYIETIKEINNTFGPFEAAVGHSFGGMAILNTQAEKKIFKTLVTIGAADLITNITQRFVQSLELKPLIALKMTQSFNKKLNINLNDYSANYAAKKVLAPTLVIHDSKDGDVPVSCAHNIRQNLKKGSLLITNGLGHTKILRDKETMNYAVNFIIKNNL
ncbi:MULTISPECIES: alpha/beta fold hydrolase [Tenacibaculum]|uniref:alpha/beta fold hydrolase n=1 Tax=Tenacibaculum TaxID=104267 RepID=UPI001F0AC963|nr:MULTISPECIES: alpha/beta hydrolase [Tenacibaculum]MCH3882901.1 alpha/beta hydrolase [Tenacibaculum aquimarinum]MDO6600838.1 alpha/beta hydrolase [Tenacibaculum sp. 1_MG-2023]